MDIEKIKIFLAKQKISYKQLKFYQNAFTHTSYVHETSKKDVESYERIEFLGDAVLGKIIAEYLFLNYSDLDPGELSLMRSNVVNKESLSQIGKDLGLEKYIFRGKGELQKNPSNSVYEDIVESFIGAIYLDLGNDYCTEYVISLFKPYIVRIDIKDLKDYKTQLQEQLQSSKRKTVNYRTVEEIKTKDGIEFVVEALLDKTVLGKGRAKSKKKAEQIAAKNALSIKVTSL